MHITIDKKSLLENSKTNSFKELLNKLSSYNFRSEFGIESLIRSLNTNLEYLENSNDDIFSIKYSFVKVNEVGVKFKIACNQNYKTIATNITYLSFDEDFDNLDQLKTQSLNFSYDCITDYCKEIIFTNSDQLIEDNNEIINKLFDSLKRRRNKILENSEKDMINSVNHIRNEIFNEVESKLKKEIGNNQKLISLVEQIGQIIDCEIDTSVRGKSNQSQHNPNYKSYVKLKLNSPKLNYGDEFIQFTDCNIYFRIPGVALDEVVKKLKINKSTSEEVDCQLDNFSISHLTSLDETSIKKLLKQDKTLQKYFIIINEIKKLKVPVKLNIDLK